MMDYLCAKFGNFSFSRFGLIVRTDRQPESLNHRQNYRQTESQRRINAILVGVSNKCKERDMDSRFQVQLEEDEDCRKRQSWS